MASIIPKFVKKKIVTDWAAEDLWLMLLKSAHTPNANTQEMVVDVVAQEITDLGGVYTAGGIALGGKSGEYDTLNAYLKAANLTIGPGSTLNYQYGIVYTKTGGVGQATYRILAQVDFGVQVVTNGSSTIQWNPLGIIYLESV